MDRQSLDLTGSDVVRAAASGDLMAQRSLVASLLMPRVLGEIIPADRLADAEHWARVAVANGNDCDTLRLIHLLGLKIGLIELGRVAGSWSAVMAEMIAYLAIVADGDDRAMAQVAGNALCEQMLAPVTTPAIVAEAQRHLSLGAHHTPYFDALASCPRAAVKDEGDARSGRFASLAAAICDEHGVDRDGAHLLITLTPDYHPELLDSLEGWTAILNDVAERLGDPPVVTTCQ